MMNRAEILEAAKHCVCGEREQDYGTPENNFNTVGLLWAVYLRAAHPELEKILPINGIGSKDVAVMMSLLKIARIATGKSPDSFVDLAGYAACAGEIGTTDKKLKHGNENRCVICDSIIPEGSLVCFTCKKENSQCTHCGTFYPNGSSLCPNCGEKV